MEAHPQDPAESKGRIDLERYVSLLQTNLRSLILLAVLLAGMAFAASKLKTPIYRASTTLRVGEEPSPGEDASPTNVHWARTYTLLLAVRPILEATIQRLGLGMDVETLGDSVEAQWVTETPFIRLYVEDTDPSQAARIANTIAQVFLEQAASDVHQVEMATPPEKPSRPSVLLNTAAGALLGLALGSGVVVAQEVFSTTVNSPGDISRRLGLSVLGDITRFDADEEGPIVADDPLSPTAYAFRALRTSLETAGKAHPSTVLLVTSPEPGDGKSTVVTNLGVVLAQRGRRVVLVEGDLHYPTLHTKLGVPNKFGLSDLFVNSLGSLKYAVQETITPGLFVLTAGKLYSEPARLLDSSRLRRILEQLGRVFEVVLIDAPPVMIAEVDALMLSGYAHGVLVVVRANKTGFDVGKETVRQLQRAKASVIGAVLTDVPVQPRAAFWPPSPAPATYVVDTQEMHSPVWDEQRVSDLRQEGDLRRVNLEGVSICMADLAGMDMTEADLGGAFLYLADLQGATLWSANLQGATLFGANLNGANLSLTNLSRANLLAADMKGAALCGADLQGATLIGADLQGAFLSFADLRGADMSEANLQGVNLYRARFDGGTKLPDWARWTPETDLLYFTNWEPPILSRSDSPDAHKLTTV